MKHYITPEQLDELTITQRRELGKWIDKKSYWVYKQVGTFDKLPKPVLKGTLPQLSVSQMIEFLDDHANKSDLEIRLHSAGTAWQRPGERLADVWLYHHEMAEDHVELCDALWEAVKAHLS